MAQSLKKLNNDLYAISKKIDVMYKKKEAILTRRAIIIQKDRAKGIVLGAVYQGEDKNRYYVPVSIKGDMINAVVFRFSDNPIHDALDVWTSRVQASFFNDIAKVDKNVGKLIESAQGIFKANIGKIRKVM